MMMVAQLLVEFPTVKTVEAANEQGTQQLPTKKTVKLPNR
jgi:hypothetical protein